MGSVELGQGKRRKEKERERRKTVLPRGLQEKRPSFFFFFFSFFLSSPSSFSLIFLIYLRVFVMDDAEYGDDVVVHEVELPNFAYRDKDFENEPLDTQHSALDSQHSGNFIKYTHKHTWIAMAQPSSFHIFFKFFFFFSSIFFFVLCSFSFSFNFPTRRV